MKLDKKAMQLYVVTDRSWLNGRSLEDQVEEIAASGATFLQLREKHLSEEAFLEEAWKIKKIAARHSIPFVINDNIEVALRAGADGVHVGQSDMQAKDVRRLIGEEKNSGRVGEHGGAGGQSPRKRRGLFRGGCCVLHFHEA